MGVSVPSQAYGHDRANTVAQILLANGSISVTCARADPTLTRPKPENWSHGLLSPGLPRAFGLCGPSTLPANKNTRMLKLPEHADELRGLLLHRTAPHVLAYGCAVLASILHLARSGHWSSSGWSIKGGLKSVHRQKKHQVDVSAGRQSVIHISI